MPDAKAKAAAACDVAAGPAICGRYNGNEHLDLPSRFLGFDMSIPRWRRGVGMRATLWFPEIRGTILGRHYQDYSDYSILGSILGPPYLWTISAKLP